MRGLGLAALLVYLPAAAQTNDTLGERARRYLADLIRIDTSNPPGGETRAAEYLKRVADANGIPSELLGTDAARLNFVARLRGNGSARPLLLMAHTDVVPAEKPQWTAEPFGAEVRDAYLYGRGAQDDKNLLAVHLAVLAELKQRGVKLNRDLILLGEADEESGSTGIQWLIRNAWEKIDAEAALNEGGVLVQLRSGSRLYHVQTAEKIPTRVILRARGTAAHASLPRFDNPIVRLARAILRLDTDQPVRLNPTTRRYFTQISKLPEYSWLSPLVPRLDHPLHQVQAASLVRSRDLELDAQLRTSVSPTMLQAGLKINIIPNTAEAQIDVRRLPNETREEVLSRFRRLINDTMVDVLPADANEMPATEPSTITGPIYRAIERVLLASHPNAVVVPFMSRGATDGAFLRQKGMAVYGVPLFFKENGGGRAHGNDERISLANLDSAAELLWRIVLEIAAAEEFRAH